MSLIGLDEIKQRIGSTNLVADLGDRDLHNPEGVGIDLRLGAVFEMTEGGAFIECDGQAGQGLRKGVQTKEILSFQPEADTQEFLTIKPKEYYLIQTFETINTPLDLMPMVYPRSSLFRAGLLLLNSKTDPGYQGKLIMGLTNLSAYEVKIQMGARICNMVFYQIAGQTVQYRGQHQGGRVAPGQVERQV